MSTVNWTWDAAAGAYLDPATGTYAIPDASGEWTYLPANAGWGGLDAEDAPPAAHASASASSSKAIAVLRLVVERSDVLDPGLVAMIDAREGGVQIGRDRCERGAPARVRLKEMAVSKTHAAVYHDEGWWIVDQGSTHGTFAPDRLSEAKHASKPHRLDHLSTIRIGSTTFIAHIHPGWACDKCQLHGTNELRLDEGATPATESGPESDPTPIRSRYETKEDRRKREMAALKSIHLGDSHSHSHAHAHGRIAPRRRPDTRRSASPPMPPQQRNIGAEILAAQGWKGEGQGLGRTPGRAEPVRAVPRMERAGLGTNAEIADDWRERAKQRRYDTLR